jgi:DNA-binding transcriptional MerR regulator
VDSRATPPRFVSIKTILQRTGVHRQTVHYYLRRDILPPPIRTSRTSALYPVAAIELIELVQALQRHQRLSLEEIAVLFRRHNYDVKAIRHDVGSSRPESLQGVLSPGTSTFLPASEVAERLHPAPPREWVTQVLESHIVNTRIHDGRKEISAHSLEALRAVWDGVRSGATLEQFRRLSGEIEKSVAGEFQDFIRNLRHLPSSREAAPQVARLFASLENFGAHRRRDSLHTLFLERAREPRSMFLNPNRTYVFPSRTFLQRMGLFRELDLILRQLDKNPNDLNALKNLARASYLSSDWTRLHFAAMEILRLVPLDADAQALYGQALMFLGRLPESIAFLEDVIARGPNPMAKIRLGQAIATQAFESGDAMRLIEAAVRRSRLASEAIRESANNAGLHRKVRLNAMLDDLYFSDPLGLNRPTEKEILALYREFRSLSGRNMPALGKISLAMARIYATYALYLLRQQEGDPKAGPLMNEIARLDPDCVLASRSGVSPKARKKSPARSPRK